MDQFLEVLLEGFQLTRRDGAPGVELSVAFENSRCENTTALATKLAIA